MGGVLRDKINTLTVIPLTDKKKTDISGCVSLVPVREGQPTATGLRKVLPVSVGLNLTVWLPSWPSEQREQHEA